MNRPQRSRSPAVLLTHDGYGHVSFQDPSACMDRWRPRYPVEPETPPPGALCRADEQPFQPTS